MIDLPMAPLVPSQPMQGDEKEMAHGIGHCHNQLNKLAEQIFNAAAQLAAVTNVLQARGLLSDEEVAEQRKAEEQRLLAFFQERAIGVQVDMRVPDKYALPTDQVAVIDCENRYHLCHAACCALRFALSRQDLDEGIVRWELGDPYRNRIGDDGHCVHLDRGSMRCSIYAHRPGICRTYDCRNDKRVWLDFEARIPNPELLAEGPDGRRVFRFNLPAQPEPDERANPPAPAAVTDEP